MRNRRPVLHGYAIGVGDPLEIPRREEAMFVARGEDDAIGGDKEWDIVSERALDVDVYEDSGGVTHA